MFSRTHLTFMSLLTAALLTSCSSQEPPTHPKSHDLHLALRATPLEFDTRKARDEVSNALGRMFSEGLLRYNFNGEISPGLAMTYTLDEAQTTYTFTLRDNLCWSTGQPLTAHDFVYAWQKILDPNFDSEYAYSLFVIKNAQDVKEGKLPTHQLGVRAVDDTHLEVELHQPVSYFPEMVAFNTYFAVPKDIDEKYPHWSEQNSTQLPSCGPFQFVKLSPGKEVQLIKNPHYWDANQVHLDRIQFSIVHNEAVALQMFERGELDFIGSSFGGVLPDNFRKWTGTAHLHTHPIAHTLWYKINTTVPGLRNQKIRQALSLALDRQYLSHNVTHDTLLPATNFLPPVMSLNKPLISEFAMREKAHFLLLEGLREEGIEWSELPQLHLSLNDTLLNRQLAQASCNQWKENLGIDVLVEFYDWNTHLSHLHKMDYEIARIGWSADYLDAMNFLEPYKFADSVRGGNNETGWQDPRFIELLDAAAASHTKDQYHEYLAQAERLLVQACPVIPVLHYTINWLQVEHLQDVSVSSLSRVDFKWARLQPTISTRNE